MIEAIEYADSKGIQILVYCHGKGADGTVESSRLAIQNYSGLFVCSAGNSQSNNDVVLRYPCGHNLPNLISVGASDEYDREWYNAQKNKGTNYGATTVDLFAPGDNLTGIYYQNHAYVQGAYGTSFAAPYVAGVAALLLSKYPELSACEIKETILTNVDIVYDETNENVFEGRCVSGGRLNAYKSLTNVVRHSFSYNDEDNNEQHGSVCLVCDYTFDENHSFTYSNSNLFSGHIATCTKCNYSVQEGHDWQELLSGYRCRKCFYRTEYIPITPLIFKTMLPVLHTQLINNFTDDYAINVDENTVLCYIDERYYLVKGYAREYALEYIKSQACHFEK